MKIRNVNYIAKYWKAIQSGKVEVSEKVRLTMRELIDVQEGKVPGYHFDVKLANKPIFFIESYCKQSKGTIGEPIKLELFEKAVIQAVYGVVDNHGLRRTHELLWIMGRKNGKSTVLSALALYSLIGDKEGGPEIDCVSTKKDAAKIVFDAAKNMVRQSPDLNMLVRKRQSDLYCDFNLGVLQPLSSDSNTLDGLNPSVVILDELHSIKQRNLYDVTRQALSAKSRKQPLYLIITTSGFNREGIYDELYEYAEECLRDRSKDEHFLSFIYELDSLDEWDKEDKWIKANPGLGTIKSLERLRADVEKAKISEGYKPTVLTKDFNLKNVDYSSWLTWEQIDNQEQYDLEELRDTYGIGGCDLSAVHDMSCASILVRKRNDDKLYLLQHYFIPESKIDYLAAKSSKEAPYEKWAERGLLTICRGEMINYSDVTAWFKKMRDDYQIDLWRVGYDRAMANYWVEEMAYQFGQSVMESVPQGAKTWTMPMKELGAVLAEHRINFNNNPIFKWCLMNTAVKTVGALESIEPVKIQRGRRIDGMVSALNAYVIYVKYKNDYLNLVG